MKGSNRKDRSSNNNHIETEVKTEKQKSGSLSKEEIAVTNEAKEQSSEVNKETINNENKISEVIYDGESYCLIAEPTSKDENSNETLKENSQENESDENRKQAIDENKDEKEEPLEESASHPKKLERSCQISSVVMMRENEEKFIIAGVKIESKKTRKNKTRHKYKLSLLVYKIHLGSTINKDDQVVKGGVYPSNTDPFIAMDDFNSEEEFLEMGPEVDYFMENAAENAKYLKVIDGYLIANHKNPCNNGGTQNIAVSGNEIKTGFDQEEIIKRESVQTVYEDCVFHKYDVDRNLYHHGMFISNLFVVDKYLIAVLNNEKSCTEESESLLLILSIVNKKQSIEIKLVNKYSFPSNVTVKDTVKVPYKKLSTDFLINLKALQEFESSVNGDVEPQLQPNTLLLFGLSDKTFMFLSVPQLTAIQIPSYCTNQIHKIAYCSALSSIAVCDELGNFILCPYLNKKKSSAEANINSDAKNIGKYSYYFHFACKVLHKDQVTSAKRYFFKVNDRNTRNISHFEHISHVFVVFPLWTLNK